MTKFVVPSVSTMFLAVVITPELMNAIAGAAAIVLSAIFVGVVNVIAVRAAARKAIAPVAVQVEKIEAHVNSEATRYQGVIASQAMQIDLQRETIDELKKAAALLAQAKAALDLSTSISQAAVAGAMTPAKAAPPKESI